MQSDRNAPAIVKALREVGASVKYLHGPERKWTAGIPDFLVGHGGKTYLIEVKNPANKSKSGKLSPSQQKFRDEWRGGPIATVHSETEALIAIGLVP